MNSIHISAVLPPHWDLLHFQLRGVYTLVLLSPPSIWWARVLPKLFGSHSVVGGGVQYKQLC